LPRSRVVKVRFDRPHVYHTRIQLFNLGDRLKGENENVRT